MNKLFVGIAAAGLLLSAPAFAQNNQGQKSNPAPPLSQSNPPASQTKTPAAKPAPSSNKTEMPEKKDQAKPMTTSKHGMREHHRPAMRMRHHRHHHHHYRHHHHWNSWGHWTSHKNHSCYDRRYHYRYWCW
ncbi:MAG TPA: hypothetical protein VG672_22090 [Bryobacteraceae bacterium]|nr:hypothetical protein [Bryobacteraceae bacterium]